MNDVFRETFVHGKPVQIGVYVSLIAPVRFNINLQYVQCCRDVYYMRKTKHTGLEPSRQYCILNFIALMHPRIGY